uniref:Uncharacterized protein n=1 Tax=Romanomermis culicivorax TaxID=13658 RepID=A0A915KXZ1_ROMCU
MKKTYILLCLLLTINDLYKPHHMSKQLFSNYLRGVRAKVDADSSHGHSLRKFHQENEDIDEVVICENNDF